MKNNSTKGYVFMAMSIDGFIARDNHSLDWLSKYDTKGEDHGYLNFMKYMDVLVMGSGSFKTVVSFDAWPYEIPVFVMSSTLVQNDIPKELQAKVTITKKLPIPLMKELFTRGYQNAYVDGGRIVQSFLKEGLIKELTITQIPTLIGGGKKMFGSLKEDIQLSLINSNSFPSGFVQNHYKILK